jgi:hypothetical protein
MGTFVTVVICLGLIVLCIRALRFLVLTRTKDVEGKRDGAAPTRGPDLPPRGNFAWMDQNQPLAQRREPVAAPVKMRSGRRAVDDSLPNEEWLAQGHRRFERDKQRYFGSPETMRGGAHDALAGGDRAAALFFFVKAVDIAQTWSFMKPAERPPELDDALFDEYVSLVCELLDARPGLNVLSGYNEDGYTAGAYMARLARTPRQQRAVDRFISRTGMPRP